MKQISDIRSLTSWGFLLSFFFFNIETDILRVLKKFHLFFLLSNDGISRTLLSAYRVLDA